MSGIVSAETGADDLWEQAESAKTRVKIRHNKDLIIKTPLNIKKYLTYICEYYNILIVNSKYDFERRTI